MLQISQNIKNVEEMAFSPGSQTVGRLMEQNTIPDIKDFGVSLWNILPRSMMFRSSLGEMESRLTETYLNERSLGLLNYLQLKILLKCSLV